MMKNEVRPLAEKKKKNSYSRKIVILASVRKTEASFELRLDGDTGSYMTAWQ